MIEVNELNFGYLPDKPILKEISARAENSSITVLLGVNGCGKSTLLKCLTRLHKTSNGNIIIDGKKLSDMNVEEISKKIAYVSQLSDVESETIVWDYIVEGRTPHLSKFGTPGEDDYTLCEKYANELGISELLEKNLKHLSGGQKQLAAIARALVQESNTILLDEPLSALDLKKQSEVLNIFRKLADAGKTIIFSSHNPNHAFLLESNVWLLNNGKVETGIAKSLLTEKKLKIIYGEYVNVFKINNSNYCEICL